MRTFEDEMKCKKAHEEIKVKRALSFLKYNGHLEAYRILKNSYYNKYTELKKAYKEIEKLKG